MAQANSSLLIAYSRPRVTELNGYYEGFANTPESFVDLVRVVNFDFCNSSAWTTTSQPAKVHWSFFFRSEFHGEIPVETVVSTNCRLSWQGPTEGRYRVSVSLSNLGVSGTLDFLLVDLWLVAIGDSFASGQGNPDISAPLLDILPSQWISAECYRSGHGSFSYQVYKALEQHYKAFGILFTYIPCSGATILHGLLGNGANDLPQLPVVAAIRQAASSLNCRCQLCCQAVLEAGGRKEIKPDVLLMSIGGNDINFSEIIYSLMWGRGVLEFSDVSGQIGRRLSDLEKNLDSLASELQSQLGLEGAEVFYTQYYDISRNERGEIDASCPSLQSATTKNFQRAIGEILNPLNHLIARVSRRHGWTLVDKIPELFRTHGICSKVPHIRTIADSLRLQGNTFGAFHPSRAGHVRVAKRVWQKVRQHLRSYNAKVKLL